MNNIIIYNDGIMRAKTSKAFGIMAKKEFMRAWTLDINFVNNDNATQYAIHENAAFEVEGEQYEITRFNHNSGSTNTTSVSANHISYRANNYTLPVNYSFVGTIAAILADMLANATDTNGYRASDEFTVGTGTANAESRSVSLGNTQPITLRAAVWKFQTLGFEADYNNLKIIIDQPRTPSDKVFTFGRDLCNIDRSFDKTTTPPSYSYTIDIADLQVITGETEFALGDIVGIKTDKDSAEITQQQIVSYNRCLDDPTQDQVTIGTFKSDYTDISTSMEIDITATTKVANNSLQQGENYSNVSISHEEGFKATNADETVVVKMNAADGFAIYDGNGNFVGGIDTNGNFVSSRISTPGTTPYGRVGVLSGGGIGMELFSGLSAEAEQLFCYIAKTSMQSLEMASGNGLTKMQLGAGGSALFGNDTGAISIAPNGLIKFLRNGASFGLTTSFLVGTTRYYFTEGLLTNIT